MYWLVEGEVLLAESFITSPWLLEELDELELLLDHQVHLLKLIFVEVLFE